MRFLDFAHFGVPGPGELRLVRMLVLSGAVLPALLAGCAGPGGDSRTEDSLTAGSITVVCAPEAGALFDAERGRFQELYPDARLRVVPGGSREAIRALFAAEADLAVVARELSPEERGAAVRGRLELEGYRFAKDAVVVVVHPENRVENLALDDLRRIYDNRLSNWGDLGGDRVGIEPVFPDPGSDLAEFFVHDVMGGEAVKARVAVASSDSATVVEVLRRPGGIGFVSLSAATRGARTLRLSRLQGLPYWKPDLEAVHDGDYPLARPHVLYVRADAPPLARGVVTFVTSREGQEIVHRAGLVPTTVPVRFVRRSPMQGTHQP